MRSVSLSVLDQVRVASPCPADWAAMAGDERVRHCEQCHLNVYNISEMNKAQAEALIQKHEGRLCVRYYQRGDGTIQVRDCPVGLAAVRAKAARMVTRVAGVLMVLLSAGAVFGQRGEQGRENLRDLEPFASLTRWLSPSAGKPMVRPGRQVLMGAIACPPPVQRQPQSQGQ